MYLVIGNSSPRFFALFSNVQVDFRIKKTEITFFRRVTNQLILFNRWLYRIVWQGQAPPPPTSVPTTAQYSWNQRRDKCLIVPFVRCVPSFWKLLHTCELIIYTSRYFRHIRHLREVIGLEVSSSFWEPFRAGRQRRWQSFHARSTENRYRE